MVQKAQLFDNNPHLRDIIKKVPIKDRNEELFESMSRGMITEQCFRSVCKKCGWNAEKSTSDQDRIDHWDFTLTGFNQSYRVEVKSRKKISRHSNEVQDKLIWVELHGRTRENSGWLNGKADLIAFEREDDFVLVKRLDLLKLVKQKVRQIIVDYPDKAVYKIYWREDGHYQLTLIPIEDILDLMVLKFDKD